MGLMLPDVSRMTSLMKMPHENCATPCLADCELSADLSSESLSAEVSGSMTQVVAMN